MYNKTHCSTAKNSSFLKCFLVRLRCKRKPVEKWSRQRFLLFQPRKNQLATTCVHVCPLNQTTDPGSTETAATLLFHRPDLWPLQPDSSGQPGAPTLVGRERLSDWTIKKIPSVHGELCWEWSALTQSRPTGAAGGGTKWMPRRPGNPQDLNASVMEQLSWRVSDMLQPLWHK